MTITFFGHSNTPQCIQVKLKNVLIDLIEKNNATLFYVGNNGNFDSMVRKTLKDLKLNYSHINYTVVLAYIPYKQAKFDYTDYSDTMLPDNFENVPPKYAIIKRNRWMIEQSDTVVTYVKHSVGGAAQFKALAEKSGKWVINLADSD